MNLASRIARPKPSLAFRLVAAAGLMVALSACKTLEKPVIVGSVPDDYRRNHPISIDESIDTMDIPVGLNTGHLPEGMKANIAGFARKFVLSGSALVAIVIPVGSPNASVASAVGAEIQDVLVSTGIDPKAVEFRSYRAASGENSAPIRIAYARISAKTEPCGPWPDQTAKSSENRHPFNYGCASQTNLAAMVSNPLDLLYPRGETPPDATRRMGVLKNYEIGKPWQTDYGKEVGVSQVAKGVGG